MPSLGKIMPEDWDFSNVATGPAVEMPDFSENKYTVVSSARRLVHIFVRRWTILTILDPSA